MEIILNKSSKGLQFEATNDSSKVHICASQELSPEGIGFRPTELLLASLASCLSIDILNILAKQRQIVEEYSTQVSGEREQEIPRVFKCITVHLTLKGNISEKHLQRAIQLIIDKYCTINRILQPTAEIVINQTILKS